ncbi:MAG: GtrA family protein [Clostridiales bacterium]|jgi:putative flippase GtrA|nr:GtrA family protein [Clostridiales bacterium]
MKDKYRHNIRYFLKFAVTGVSTAVLEFLIFVCLRKLFHTSVELGNGIALVVALFINFNVNRKWSFKSNRNVWVSAFYYILLFTFNFLFTTGSIKLLINLGIWDIVAKPMTQVVCAIWNFVFYKKIIFKEEGKVYDDGGS